MSNVFTIIPKRSRKEWAPFLESLHYDPAQLTDIPILGQVAAGNPIDIIEYHETVSVPVSMVRKNTYALRVKGHSMIEDNIQDGDIIVVEKRETATNGQSVIALINNETVTLKKFYVEPHGIRLQPANPNMSAIYLKNEDVQVLGIVAGVIRLS